MEGALPYFQPPRDAHGYIVYNRLNTSTKDYKYDKFIGIDYKMVKYMTEREAYREALQNMIDSITQANGKSYNGIKIRTETRGDTHVTIFYTDTYIFGEVCVSPHQISFVNMGPEIESVDQLLRMGASNKSELENQAGQHGEGLNYLVTRLVQYGFLVDIYFVMREGNRVEARTLDFFHSKKRNGVGWNFKRTDPITRIKNDEHRFELTVKTGKHVVKFDVFDWLIKDLSFFRDPKYPNEAGIIILDPALAGHIYVWHIHVAQYSNLVFGYDLYLERIVRERNLVEHKILCAKVASIWSNAVIQDAEMAITFVKRVLLVKDIRSDTIEVVALEQFSVLAAKRLFEIVMGKQQHRRPIKESDVSTISPQFRMDHFMVVSDQAVTLFSVFLPPLNVYLNGLLMEFERLPIVQIKPVFVKRVLDFSAVYDVASPVNFSLALKINIARFASVDFEIPSDQMDRFWNIILFVYLPKIHEKNNAILNGVSIIDKIVGIRLSKRELTLQKREEDIKKWEAREEETTPKKKGKRQSSPKKDEEEEEEAPPPGWMYSDIRILIKKK